MMKTRLLIALAVLATASVGCRNKTVIEDRDDDPPVVRERVIEKQQPTTIIERDSPDVIIERR
jgi:hypothetical protein